jgi:putative ABC transport system permease protein
MPFQEFRRRLAHLFHRDESAIDLNEEMRLHVDLRARKLQQQGTPASDALGAARRQFGNPAMVQDSSSSLWGWTAWERLAQDFRLGLRMLRKTPGFSAVAVLTLALGLGMNTAVFSVVNAVMLRGLPYPEPRQLLSLWEEQIRVGAQGFSSSGASLGGAGTPPRTTVSMANIGDYRAQTAFSGLAAFDSIQLNLTGNAQPERLAGEAVTASFFSVLGVHPQLGREFLPEEEGPDGRPAVIITHDFWQQRLGGDTDVLARALVLDGRPYPIVGVLAPDFASPVQLANPNRLQFYVPLALSKEIAESRGDHDVNVICRLRPGMTVENARAQLGVLNANLARQYPNTNSNIKAAVAPLGDDLVRNVTDSLVALLGASGLIVLITCVNVANLLLVRSIGRRHETSVRLALGASRFRVIRQFLAESMIVSAAGCAAGILLGLAMIRAIVALAPRNIPRIQSVSMDWTVFAMAAAVAVLTGLVFGLAPAWQASDAKPAESLKSTGRAVGGPSQVRWRTALTVAEVALSMILLVGAGLLLKSFVTLMGVDLGFQPDRVLAMNINLPELRYGAGEARLRFFQQLEERVSALPGVDAVGFANRMPLRGGWSTGIRLDATGDATYTPEAQAVNPGYFPTIGIPLLRGRLLTAEDRRGAPYVAVVNQAFARQYMNNQDPVGHPLQIGTTRPWMTIVGMVNDIRRGGKEEPIKPQLYVPAAQNEYPVRLADFAVRTGGNPRQLLKSIQQQVWSLDKDQPVTTVRTLEEIVTASAAQRRFQTTLLLIFAGVAVMLAVIGIYGVLSYAVSQRTSEIGLRMALGAEPRRILALVLRQAGVLIAVGVVLGTAGTFALTRYLTSLLFGVQPGDLATYLAAAALLATVSTVAALVPARRGAKIDPIVALRYE